MTPHLAFPPSPPRRRPGATGLAEGIALSRMYGKTLTPVDVARVLSRAGVRYVVAGAHAINLYTGKPRATCDVDLIVASPARARRALERAYPQLPIAASPAGVRFGRPLREALDVVEARSSKLLRRVLRLARSIELEGQRVSVPTVEAALAMKYASMIDRGRAIEDRMQDAVDFARAAILGKRANRRVLRELGELAHADGGDELLTRIDDARTGRQIDL